MNDDIAPLLAKARAARRAGNAVAAFADQQEAIALIRAANDPRLPTALRQAIEMAIEAGLAEKVSADLPELMTLHRHMRETAPLELASAFRVVALHAQAIGNDEAALANWQEARALYAGLNFADGIAEADMALAALKYPQ